MAGTHVGIDSGSAEMARITLDGFIEAFAAYLPEVNLHPGEAEDTKVEDTKDESTTP